MSQKIYLTLVEESSFGDYFFKIHFPFFFLISVYWSENDIWAKTNLCWPSCFTQNYTFFVLFLEITFSLSCLPIFHPPQK